ncbi:ABC1 domain containing protein [Metarhizium album ARSEF 1941]|uniref:ABC1 domain containing protein n=1 Tax=Metarhizium album (strain ARSEF 1941) TaxID=1081103 RepID=A0A0B2WSY4_METAS|nr:ABC1 domain containing protein [Metarhizium album ARSEF 1941]KHN96724.1 ABC1 domain containing protein [Metarhizium album ARSEF 1941]
MAPKRPGDLIPNPSIKKRNLQWKLSPPNTPGSSSPPNGPSSTKRNTSPKSWPPTTAAIESGKARITNPADHFATHLGNHILASPLPLLPIPSYTALYAGSLTAQSSHFVIHQHDHPVAGLHYDLRLQINPASSVSWAIMYGPPGDPNSVRPNRNATETRVHSLWNHLVETASPQTGSLLIWDTGTYTVLPRRAKHAPTTDPSSQSSPEDEPRPQQELLQEAFRNRKIRLQLHGSKLPETYVVNLRLTKQDDAEGRAKSNRQPRGKRTRVKQADPETSSNSDVITDDEHDEHDEHDEADGKRVLAPGSREVGQAQHVSALKAELQELEDAEIRRTNAYPGASNTIGSIHQRRWYLSLDRRACGFEQRLRGRRAVWQCPSTSASTCTSDAKGGTDAMQRLSFPFYVRGVLHERSVVTARTGEDVMHDEGVRDFVRRKGWQPVLN